MHYYVRFIRWKIFSFSSCQRISYIICVKNLVPRMRKRTWYSTWYEKYVKFLAKTLYMLEYSSGKPEAIRAQSRGRYRFYKNLRFMKIFFILIQLQTLKKSSLPKLLYFVTVFCFHLAALFIFEKYMLCLVRKNWASNKIFQETCLKASKNRFQDVCSVDADFIPLWRLNSLR